MPPCYQQKHLFICIFALVQVYGTFPERGFFETEAWGGGDVALATAWFKISGCALKTSSRLKKSPF